MPLISVVVPIYNVERYLAECLESLAGQTHHDLEVVMVDDGSTDSSAGIAARFAERDPRFRLVQQPNGGLGHARNTGAEHATGDYLAFVDSDDVVVRNAYELLGGSLEETGSDFASGNYHRLTVTGTWQSAMVAATFRANRLKTHVSKHPALLNDRTAWNKLFRRSFWTLHEFRWPEGVLYEDIPVTLPAHVLASSVDVLRQPIYLWRARVGDSSSITQRRTEPRAIRDRTAAVDSVSRFLAEHGQQALKKQYDRSVAEQDLGYFLSQLDGADDEFRAVFLDLVNDFFDRADSAVFDGLPAIQRLEWHLVRRRLTPELLEVLRFEKSGEINWTPVVRKRRKFWGDYPFRGNAELAIPDSVYRLDREELPLRAVVEDVAWDADRLRVTGYAQIAFQDLSKEGSARIRLTLEESGHAENVVAMAVRMVRRPDVTETAPDGVTNYDWCGFEATAPVTDLQHRGKFRDGHWRLRVEVRSHGIMRRRWLARTEPGRAKRPEVKSVDGVRVVPTSEVGDFAVQVSATSAEVTDVRVDTGVPADTGVTAPVLELHGMLHRRTLDPATARLRVARTDGTATLHFPAAAEGLQTGEGRPFVARVPLAELRVGEAGDVVAAVEERGDGVEWELALLPDSSDARRVLVAAAGLPELRRNIGDRELAVRQTRTGRLHVVERRFRPRVEAVRWSDDGSLELSGSYHEPTGSDFEVVLRENDRALRYVVPAERDGTRFTARLRPDALPTVAGGMALAYGTWNLLARPDDAPDPVRLALDPALLTELPIEATFGSRTVTLIDVDVDGLALQSSTELPPSQLGRAGRRRLQTADYPTYLRSPVRDLVLVDAYASGQYGGDARAVLEELRRRAGDLDVVWSVVDGQAVLPEDVRPVPRYGRDWFEALSRSRYVATADLRGVPDLAKADGQRVLQTWHGVPVTPVGLEDSGAGSRLGGGWEAQVRREAAQWDVLLSSGLAHTEVLRRAFDVTGGVLESGLPRHDLLVTADREEVTSAVRSRLGIDPSRRLVLYAPTYRPQRQHRGSLRRGLDRYRFDLELDVDHARSALGDDHVLLVRAHPKAVDGVGGPDASIVDVSRWSDVGELLVAADMLVTDQSSLVVDFALTGRPMVLWLPELAEGGAPDRRWTVDPGSIPAAIVGDAEAMLAAVRDTAAAPDPQVARAFISTWAPMADGKAAARAVDALLDS